MELSGYDQNESPSAQGRGNVTSEPNSPLKNADRAPDFCLKATPDQTVSLSDYAGQPAILIFYPADFSPVCGDELALFNELLPEFGKYNARLAGISVDNVWCHLAFAKDRHLHFPLLSDFHPKGRVSNLYHSYRQEEGESERSIYLIDPDGKIAWGYISPIGINPGANGILKALEDLPSGNGNST